MIVFLEAEWFASGRWGSWQVVYIDGRRAAGSTLLNGSFEGFSRKKLVCGEMDLGDMTKRGEHLSYGCGE